MKQQKSHYFKWGLTVFLTVCAILAFYDTFYMNGTLQRYLSKLVTVLAPVLYGFAMAYLLAPIVNWIEGLIRKGLKRLSKGQEPKLRGGLLRGVSILLTSPGRGGVPAVSADERADPPTHRQRGHAYQQRRKLL